MLFRFALVICSLFALGCSQRQRQTFACEHCACGDRDLTHPVRCELLGTDQWVYCCAIDGS